MHSLFPTAADEVCLNKAETARGEPESLLSESDNEAGIKPTFVIWPNQENETISVQEGSKLSLTFRLSGHPEPELKVFRHRRRIESGDRSQHFALGKKYIPYK